MQPLSGLSAIIPHYEALILDLWGVIHDGTHLYPGVHGALEKLRAADKQIILLSNAPRRARKVETVLHQLGIESGLYDLVLSSGEAGFQWLASQKPYDSGELRGKRYYYIGPDKDLDVMDGIDYQRVDEIKQADFLLNVGFGSDDQTSEDWNPLLRAAKAISLPMLCLNPDLEVVKISGERFACAGVIAHNYKGMGGHVLWFGKPFPSVYETCLEFLAPVRKSSVLAIGDSLETDIPGAANFGIDSVLVTGGILKHETAENIEATCRSIGLKPNYIMPQLTW